ncbi:MAG TPA: hypothetical protein PLS03_16815 [Terrimicrobiaceae bacterium]|nr:hypothetical protein [Terrimicrobiaceae bacterium]
MKAHEILSNFSDETAGQVFQHLYENDKPAYRACLQLLASRRRLRPVILERKSRVERHAWMRAELSRKSNEDASIEVLQTWLLGAHKDVVCGFLDDLGVAHNGHGLLETLPAQPPAEKLQAAVNGLLARHPGEVVFAYLNLFVEMDIAEWPALKEILQQDSRLCRAPQPQAA